MAYCLPNQPLFLPRRTLEGKEAGNWLTKPACDFARLCEKRKGWRGKRTHIEAVAISGSGRVAAERGAEGNGWEQGQGEGATGVCLVDSY